MKTRIIALLIFALSLAACAQQTNLKATGRGWKTDAVLFEYRLGLGVAGYWERLGEVDKKWGTDGTPEYDSACGGQLKPQKFPKNGDRYCQSTWVQYYIYFGKKWTWVDESTYNSYSKDQVYTVLDAHPDSEEEGYVKLVIDQ